MSGSGNPDHQTQMSIEELDDLLRREVRHALVTGLRKKSPQFISTSDAAIAGRMVNYLLDWGTLDGIAEKLRTADRVPLANPHFSIDPNAASCGSSRPYLDEAAGMSREVLAYRSVTRGCE